MKKTEVTLLDIKTALRDPKFRDKLPATVKDDVQKYLSNPNCTCNFPIYEKILKEAKKEIQAYFPDKEYKSTDDKLENLAKNNFSVINCSIGELEYNLKSLKPGRKQIAVTRYEDQVTVVVNELESLF